MGTEPQDLRKNTAPGEWLSVLGIPVRFESESASVMRAVARWSAATPWSGAAPGPEHASARVRLILAERDPAPGTVLAFRTPEPGRLEIEGPGFRGAADARTCTASCVLTADALRRRERFEESVVATLTLFLITRLDRQPFHAAAIARDDRHVLLCGPSGSGKSTLAYAAGRAGWRVLSDDAVYLQSRPAFAIWPAPGRLHLPPDAAEWFPELRPVRPVLRENGKHRLAVPPAGPAPAPFPRATLVLLCSGAEEPSVRWTDAEAAIDSLLERLDPGFDVFRETIGPALRAVTGGRVLELRTGRDPRTAVAALETTLAEGGG